MLRTEAPTSVRDLPPTTERPFFAPAPTGASPPVRVAPGAPLLFGSLVGEIMTPKVVTVHPTDSLWIAATLLSEMDFSGLPVVSRDGTVVGVLSEKDLLRVLKVKARLKMPGGLFGLILENSETRQHDELARCQQVLHGTLVSSAMTSPAHTVTPETPTLVAAREMLTLDINRMPVVDHGKLVGIVTRANVLTMYHGV